MTRLATCQEVIETLGELMVVRGIAQCLRSGNGPDFVARELRDWLGKVRGGTL